MKKKVAGVFSLGVLFSTMFLLPYIKYIFYDALLEATGFSNTQIGALLSVYIAVCMVTTLLSGYLADRFPVKKMIVASGISHGVLTCCYPFFMTSYPATVVVWGLMGVTSMLLFWSQTFKGVSMLGSQEEQGKLYGLFESSNGLASMVFSFTALFVFSRFSNNVASLRAVVFTYGFFSLLAATLVGLLFHPENSDYDAPAEDKVRPTTKEIIAVLKLPEVWILSFVFFGIYAFYSGSSYLTPYFSTVLGVTVVFSGSLATIKNYGTRFIGGYVAGVISDKKSTLTFVLFALLTMAGLMVVFMLVPGTHKMLIPIIILMLLLAFVNTGAKGVMYSITDEIGIPMKLNGIAIAMATMIGLNLPDLFVHPLFGSWLDKYEPVAAYRLIFMTLLGFIILGFFATLILIKKYAVKGENVNKEVG